MPVVTYRRNLISFNTTIILQYYYSYRRSSTVINPHRRIYVLRVMLVVVGSVMLAILALSCDCGSRIASRLWSHGRCVTLCSRSSRQARGRHIMLVVVASCSRSSHHIVLISPIISLLLPCGSWLRTDCRADDINGPF